jgi:hypothetical protein
MREVLSHEPLFAPLDLALLVRQLDPVRLGEVLLDLDLSQRLRAETCRRASGSDRGLRRRAAGVGTRSRSGSVRHRSPWRQRGSD